MALTPAQKEAAAEWRREESNLKWIEESRSRARYLQKYVRDIGNIDHPEAEDKLSQIRQLADEINDLLYDHTETTPSYE